jgi:outer membrane lipoprotein SlyB
MMRYLIMNNNLNKRLFSNTLIKGMIGFITLSLFVTGCARDISSNVYKDNATSGIVLEGVVVSMRPVTVQSADKLGDNHNGRFAGGALGAVAAGSSIGNGGGSLVAAVGGAIIGAVIGAAVEGNLSKTEAMEYVVRVKGKNPMRNPSSDATLVSVVQSKKQLFSVNQHVYVIYNGDRARLVPLQSYTS